jgi:hypothetical protein
VFDLHVVFGPFCDAASTFAMSTSHDRPQNVTVRITMGKKKRPHAGQGVRRSETIPYFVE